MTAWTTDTLLSDIRRKGRIPPGDPTYTSSAILREADEALHEMFAGELLKISENYGVKTKTFPIVAQDDTYRIPSRAYGDLLLHAEYVDEAGTARRLNHYHLGERYTLYEDAGGPPVGFVLEGNEVALIPPPISSVGQLRVRYQHRPGQFIVTTEAMQITGISGTTLTGVPPSSWTTSSIVDLIQDQPGFDTLAIDQAVTAVTGATVTLASALPADLVVGDWVSLAMQTPVVQIPLELHGPLTRAVAGRIRMDIGDVQAGDRLLRESEAGIARVVSAFTPRMKGISRKVHNPHSFLRGGRFSGQGWGGRS